ncbi:MFS transporter [Rossellomorea sp. GAMAL-10_SWC]
MLHRQKRWILIALPIFFFWFFGQIDKVGISVIQTDPEFLKALGMTGVDKNAKIGLLSFVFTIAYGISNLFWGFIIDKFGARKTAIAGLFVWSLTMFSSGLSTTYEAFIISRIILGFGEGMMIPVSGKFISAWFNKRELGRAQASWLTGNYLGPAIGAVILVLVISSLHWQSAFFLLAGFNFLINIPMFIFLTRNTPGEHPWVSKEELDLIHLPVEPIEHQVSSSNRNKNFIQDYRFWIVWFGMLVCSFLFFGISIWLPTYLIEAKGFEREGMTSITSLSWLFALGFVLACGFLADKTRRPSLMASILFSLTALFLTTAVFVPNPVLAGICMGLAMGCQGGVFHLSNMFLVKYSTQETAGRAAGLIGFTNLMGGFSSYIMGWLRDSSGGNFTTSIIMLIITALLGLIAYLFSIKEEATELRAVPLPPQKINA